MLDTAVGTVLPHLSLASKHRTACVVISGPLAMAIAIEAIHKPANDQASRTTQCSWIFARWSTRRRTARCLTSGRPSSLFGVSSTCGKPLAIAKSHLFMARLTCSLATSGGVPMRIVTGVDETPRSACNDERFPMPGHNWFSCQHGREPNRLHYLPPCQGAARYTRRSDKQHGALPFIERTPSPHSADAVVRHANSNVNCHSELDETQSNWVGLKRQLLSVAWPQKTVRGMGPPGRQEHPHPCTESGESRASA